MLAYLHTTELAKRRSCWLFHSHAFSTTGIAKDFMCFHSEHIRDLSLKNSVFCIFFQLPPNAPGLFTHSVCSSWLSSIVTQNAKRACTICTHWASILLRCVRSYRTLTRVYSTSVIGYWGVIYMGGRRNEFGTTFSGGPSHIASL